MPSLNAVPLTAPAPAIRLLGPVAVLRGDGQHFPTGRGQAALLALLALQAGSAVMPHRLIADLWEDELPSDPLAALQSHVSRLRRFIGSEVLRTRSGGYLLAVPAASIDCHAFDGLVRSGLGALAMNDHQTARAALRSALARWVGEPLADLTNLSFAVAAADRLVEQRLAAMTGLIEAEIALGGHLAVLGRLAELTALHPLREDLWSLRLVALYRSGRIADALSAARSVRRLLSRETGLDPGPQLKLLERAILAHDPWLLDPCALRTRPVSAHR